MIELVSGSLSDRRGIALIIHRDIHDSRRRNLYNFMVPLRAGALCFDFHFDCDGRLSHLYGPRIKGDGVAEEDRREELDVFHQLRHELLCTMPACFIAPGQIEMAEDNSTKRSSPVGWCPWGA